MIITNLRCALGVGGSREDLSSASNTPQQITDVDSGKLASLPPVKLNLAHKVIQAATGVHHTGGFCRSVQRNFYPRIRLPGDE